LIQQYPFAFFAVRKTAIEDKSMHEIGLMQRMVEVALEHAASAGARQVQRVTVRVGAESGVVPDVITLAFEVATRGTIAEGAELRIEDVPIACFCTACDLEFAPADALQECPSCHRLGAEVRRGREFELASLEIAE
jgi:hydrogenase nickel incorporation protein HypA/HybF